VQDRDSRFVVACATGSLSADLIEQAVTITVERTHHRELHWFSDGWHGYRSILVRAYRQRVLTGKRGHPRWVVPETVSLTQTVKQRNEHGRLLSVETRAALGAGMEPAGTVHVERFNGADAAIGSMPSPAQHTPSPNAMLPGMRSWTCSSSITTSIGLIGLCGCWVQGECIAITSALRPWLWS
jgi:hypothetical protein